MTTHSETHSHSDPIRRIETRLAGTLRPVLPPNEFVHRLRGNIRLPEPRAAYRKDWRSLLLALVSVLAGFMAIVTLARVIFYLLPGRREE